MKTAVLLFALVAATILPTVGAAQNQECQPSLSARSEDATFLAITTMRAARTLALRGWENRCTSEHGDTFCNWQRAIDKHTVCNTRPNGFGGFNFTCTYTARPCRNI